MHPLLLQVLCYQETLIFKMFHMRKEGNLQYTWAVSHAESVGIQLAPSFKGSQRECFCLIKLFFVISLYHSADYANLFSMKCKSYFLHPNKPLTKRFVIRFPYCSELDHVLTIWKLHYRRSHSYLTFLQENC